MTTSEGPSARGSTKSRGSSTCAARTAWRRAAEIGVGLVLPAFERGARGEVLRPVPARGRDLRLEAEEGDADRRRAVARAGRVGRNADPARAPAPASARRIGGDRLRVRPLGRGRENDDLARAEGAVARGEGPEIATVRGSSAPPPDRRRASSAPIDQRDRVARLEVAGEGRIGRGVLRPAQPASGSEQGEAAIRERQQLARGAGRSLRRAGWRARLGAIPLVSAPCAHGEPRVHWVMKPILPA